MTTEASKAWRVLECNPRWGPDSKATGREVYLEPIGEWGDCGKDAQLIDQAPALLAQRDALLEALKDAEVYLEDHAPVTALHIIQGALAQAKRTVTQARGEATS